jgi:dihydrofolate reductase
MRKLLISEMVTLDGFFAGPNGEIDWHNVDAEFNDFAIDQLDHVDTLLFGRVTYELMASYWPTSEALKNDSIVAGKMNSLSKVVFSRTLAHAAWNNTRLVKGSLAEEITRLKQQPGLDLVIFGSGSLVSQLTRLGLIDEYRLFVNPVILGRGRSMFAGIEERVHFKLINTKPMRSGNVILFYQPGKE